MRRPRRDEDPHGFVAMWLGIAALGMWLILFLLTGFFDKAAGSWRQALSFTVGTVDPFQACGKWGEAFAIGLAVVSWLLVPVLVGSCAALLVGNAVRNSRPLPPGEAEKRTDKERNDIPLKPDGTSHV
jgi:hypothetical protein